MAEIQTKVEQKYILTLSSKEAFWLKSLTQNPFIRTEDEKDYSIRKSIFDILPEFKDLQD